MSQTAAENFVEIANRAIADKNNFTVALAGGSTPKSLYQLLADENQPFRAQVEWNKVAFFFGDERHVPPDDDESNFKMANETLLQPLDIAATSVYRIEAELDADTAAANYAEVLRQFFNPNKDEFARFDLILLGMGEEGHTASLFPGTDVIHEIEKSVAAPFVEKFNARRITLTPPVINSAANIIFFVGGAEKADALREVLTGERQPDKFPSQIVEPTNGKLLWLVDKAAAAELPANFTLNS